MATTEHDIIMQEVTTEGGTKNYKILYPTTKGSNVLCEDGNTVEEKLANQINSETGFNGLRYYNNQLQVYQNGAWVDIENGGTSPDDIEFFRPNDVTDISITAGDTTATLKFSDPTDKEIDGVMVSRWKNTVVVMKVGSYPTSVQDGTVIIDNSTRDQYKTTGFQITGLTNDTTYYLRFFVYSADNVLNSNTASEVNVTSVANPPADVTDIGVKAGNAQVTVTWDDPSTNWGGTKLVYKAGSYPTNVNDGTIAVDNQVAGQYATNGFTITGLTNDITYYFQLFPYSEYGSVNSNVANRFTATPKAVTIYGVERQISSSSTAWTRIEGGVGLTANATKNGGTVSNDFDNLYPWSDIISVDISANGTINSRYGDADFSFTNPTGHIMTYFPEFWYKRVQENGYERVYIADAETDGFTKSEAFYIGRYNTGGSTSAVNSKSGVAPLTGTGMTNLRTYSQNVGSNWGLMDIWRWSMLQILYLVEYADYNSQNTLGYGVCSGSKVNSGGCDSLGMKSGCVANAKATAVIYRGVENIFGNIYQWLDGINITGNHAWVCKNRSQYASNQVSSPYVQVSYTEPNGGYISKMGYDSNYPEVQRAIEASGSDSTYCPDYFASHSSTYAVFVGGNCGADLACGLWYANYAGPTYAVANYGGRLLFIPA